MLYAKAGRRGCNPGISDYWLWVLDTRLNNLIQSNQQQQPTPAGTVRTEFILPEFM
jgi:hypothetical protein